MKAVPLLISCLIVRSAVFSQQITITVTNLEADKGYLSALSGEQISLVDSIVSSGDGRFTFALDPRDTRPGMYRLSFGKNRWVDFVGNGEDVEIVSDAHSILDSIRVVRSESNRLYYSFRRLNQIYRTKSEVLQLVLARYPHDDPYYTVTRTAAGDLQKQYRDFVESAAGTRPSSFISRYIRSGRLPTIDLTLSPEDQLASLKAHALDSVDFSDEGLTRSDLFTNKSIEYLTLYRNPRLPKELLAKEFNIAVDTILNKAKVSAVVYKHICSYLIEGFKQFGFEECINYILDNYVIRDDLCLEGSGSTIQRMIDQKRYLPRGATAPEITLPDTAGRPVSLASLVAEKTLIVFYSTSCPHCRSMIPQLATIAGGKNPGALTVLAISLDNNIADWQHYIRANSLNWTNVIDTQGWAGRTALDYFIYATPTMFLLDKEKKIISKPLTVVELQKYF